MWDQILKIICNSKFYIPIITLLIVCIIFSILNKSLKKVVKKNASKMSTKKRNTIITLGFNIAKYAIFIVALLIILSSWGIDVTSIVAGLGVAGVVAGLALQDALKDIIMGCNIIMDNFYVVGDYITFGDFTGEVIEFGLKNTKIKDSLNHVLIIANRNVDRVINYSQGKFVLPLIINTAYEEKCEKVLKAIDEIVLIGKENEMVNDIQYIGLQSLADSSVQYKIAVFCEPANQYQVERDINGIIRETLEKHKVKIPYNQLEVHNGK